MSTAVPSREEISRLCDAYLDAVSAHDPDAVVALFAEDAQQQEPVGSPPRVGHAEIRAFFEDSNDIPFRLTRFGPINVVGNRAAFQVLVEIDTPQGQVRMTTIDTIVVNEECLISELLAFPDRETDPTDSPGARLVLAS
ncbi:SnoaL-like domain-containing protein [Nocardioides sp. JQ2195]|uniref:nuclear transport factor 2 family protein n=1 Tax=Nocardioides sp. JQ2195 TaxID=2592334 RepID=UPI00143E3E0E|nr:nuclear transport factor 2 family protein [Nocardioides sp. JQ2195]QIX26488.1 SnoaL-like domain-containing protein [Nocardioides sp. JQ2195]